ncbi:hypothetical protein OO014_18500 [Intrasporangium calvum]|uniref:UspA domain-containing protein n=1 Tax=Intrasporangium calvum TaxID=53358 RepID=A0ABT5GM07_9MICO|nr:hypothetical protein [Intrasporangium calvum]MDC5699244.1 hypothetical protein [Intrasporangium calvum]
MSEAPHVDTPSEPTEEPTEEPTVEPTEATALATVIVLTEEALKPVDVDKIVGLHAEDEAEETYRVLVPADTDRNMLSAFLNHLSLFEMREALEALRPVDREGAHADAQTALARSVEEFEKRGLTVTGEVTGDDPMPTLLAEVERLNAREVVVVTEPHAVEDTFHTDWASQAREVLGVPVLHIYAGDWRLG